MSCRAHVVVVDRERPDGSALVDTLESHRCSVTSVAPGDAAVEAVRTHGPDVIIVETADTRAAALDTVRALKSDAATRRTPLILLADALDPRLHADALDAGVDDVVSSPFHDIELYSRLRALARLNVMQSELARRDATQQRYGISRERLSPEPAGANGMAVLAAGDFEQFVEALTAAIGDASHLTFTGSPRGAIDELSAGSFDAAIVAVGGAPAEWLTMCSDLRDNPQLFHLPVLLIADPDSFPDRALPYLSGATDVLLRPVHADALRTRLRLLVQQQRYRRQMQDAYRCTRHLHIGDSLTGLYSFGFLHDYLASLISDIVRWNKELSVGFFDIDGMARINRTFGYAGGDRLLHQVGGLLGRLVRGEDLTARYGGEEFCVVMPETACDVAATVLRRIANVVGQTEFGVATAEAAATVRLKTSCTGFEPGDTAESLLLRARASVA